MDNRHIPPQDQDAEASVLGAIFLHNDAIDTAHGLVQSSDFYREAHRVIFDQMAALSDRKEPIDLITMSSALKCAGKLEEVGGAGYLSQLVDYVPTSANIAHYCKIVKMKADMRKVLLHAQETVGMIHGGKSLEEVTEHLGRVEIVERTDDAPVPAQQVLRESTQKLELRYERQGQIQGIPYGLADLDEATNGMHGGELIIIAGRPSMGKSAFASNIVESACTHGDTVLHYSLEMDRSRVMDRQIASVGRVNYGRIRSGRLVDADWSKASKAMGVIHGWKWFLDHTPGVGLRKIITDARRMKKSGLSLVVVDYLQLMRLSSKESRVQAVGEVSRGLKNLARELDIPVIALSQLNRGVDSRTDKRPTQSDLRDSGEIEQDADVILFPYRPAAYCQQCRDREPGHDYQTHQTEAEIIIEKQRDGERNLSIQAAWLGEYQTFYQMK